MKGQVVKPWVVGVVLLMLFAICATGWWVTRDRFVLVNDSGRIIRHVSVNVGGQQYQFENLPPDGSVASRCRCLGEGCFFVTVTFDSGDPVEGMGGFYEPEHLPMHQRIVIRRDGSVEFP